MAIPTLRKEDWAEIYYALDSKVCAIRNGEYEPEEYPGEDVQWLDHLQAIQEKIGPDGMNMVGKEGQS